MLDQCVWCREELDPNPTPGGGQTQQIHHIIVLSTRRRHDAAAGWRIAPKARYWYPFTSPLGTASSGACEGHDLGFQLYAAPVADPRP